MFVEGSATEQVAVGSYTVTELQFGTSVSLVVEADQSHTLVAENPGFTFPGFFVVNKLNCTGAENPSLDTASQDDPEDSVEPVPDDTDLGACFTGQATFQVAGGDLAEPITLQTSVFGFAQTELDPGTYTITETAPNAVGPEQFTIADFEFGGGFAIALAINPFSLPPGPPGPPGPSGPQGPQGPQGPTGAVLAGQGGPGARTLPNTSTDAEMSGFEPVPVLLMLVGTLSVATAALTVRRRLS